MISISDKKIILIGCCGVLGREYASYLSKKAQKLVVADRSNTNVEEYAESIGAMGIKIDLENENSVVDGVKKAHEYLGEIDGAVFNSAITSEMLSKENNSFPEFIEYPIELWNKTININLTGAFLFAREIGKVFISQKKGSLINISSIYGVIAPDHDIYKDQDFDSFPGYSASKSGIIGLSKWLSTRWASYNIRVNCVSPGGIENKQNTNFVASYSKRVPMKRMGKKKEITGILVYLLSDDSSYCTGQNFVIDGGLSTW